jgi:hypothetical protein
MSSLSTYRGFFIALFVLNQCAFDQTTKVKTIVVEGMTLVTGTLGRVEDIVQKYDIPGW